MNVEKQKRLCRFALQNKKGEISFFFIFDEPDILLWSWWFVPHDISLFVLVLVCSRVAAVWPR